MSSSGLRFGIVQFEQPAILANLEDYPIPGFLTE